MLLTAEPTLQPLYFIYLHIYTFTYLYISIYVNALEEDGLEIKVLKYLHIHNEISWGWDLILNTKFICFIYTEHTWPEGHFMQCLEHEIVYPLTTVRKQECQSHRSFRC